MEELWKSWQAFRRAIAGKRVVFFGVSPDWTEKTIRSANPDLVYLVDNSPNMIGTTWQGYEVKSPEVLKTESERPYVVITSSSFESIYPQLIGYGFEPGAEFCVTPALHDLKVITEIHNHDATLLVSSPDHKIYDTLDSDSGVGGGLYVYRVGDQSCIKVLDGTFHGIVDTGREYFVAEEQRGICRVSHDFELIDSFGSEREDQAHGIAYSAERGVVFIARTRLDKISAYDASTQEPLFDIELTDKRQKLGRPQHWINDLCAYGDYLYVSLFSHSGAYLNGVFDGGILQIDLDDPDKRYVLVQDAWMPHTVRFFDPQICYVDSLNGYLYRSIKRVIGEFPGFIRGLAYDGHYYYVGQSEARQFEQVKGLKKHIAMTAGFYMFDDETKAARFFAVPGVRQIHDLCLITSDAA